jgi:protein-S-isoprenylcysteine O-methyltransferase Ste14
MDMNRARAAAGSMLFLLVAPGVVAGLVPWLLTGWDSADPPVVLRAIGWLLIGLGGAVLLDAFGRFVVEGIGTPAPIAPTERLVVGGLYRYVRNPMYLAVAAVIIGQAAVLGRAELVACVGVFGATTAGPCPAGGRVSGGRRRACGRPGARLGRPRERRKN